MSSIILRDYQDVGLNCVRASYARGCRSPLIVAPTGAGKGTLAAYVLSEAANKGNRSLFIVHRGEIIQDVHKRITKAGVWAGILQAGCAEDIEAPIQVCSVQTLFARGTRPPADFIFWDECFPAGTLVSGRPIDRIRRGESVLSYHEKTGKTVARDVVNVFQSTPSAMVRVTLTDGATLVCTAGHPFYSQARGYVPAVTLEEHEHLLRNPSSWRRTPAVVKTVETIAPTADGTFGGACPDGYVYNIEVAENHNYFVEDVLVHNCHHCVADSYRSVRDAYPRARHLGATATPMRADRSALGDVFDDLIVIATMRDLTNKGFLVPCATIAPKTHLGHNLAQHPIDAYEDYGEGRTAFVFAPNVATAHALAKEFNARGHSAIAIDGKTPKEYRKAMMERFAQGDIRVLVNVNTMTEGVDVPRAAVAILAKKYGSPAGYIQAGGRILRVWEEGEKPSATLIDLCGNMWVHGLLADDRLFSLEGAAIRNTQKDGPDPFLCPGGCGSYLRACDITSQGTGCGVCGYKAPAPLPPEVTGDAMHVYGSQLELPLGQVVH